jgi:hypothetical protein
MEHKKLKAERLPQAVVSAAAPTIVWLTRTPLQAMQLAQQQLQTAASVSSAFLHRHVHLNLALDTPRFPLQGRAFGSILSRGSPLPHLLRFLREICTFLAQPLVRVPKFPSCHPWPALWAILTQ